MSKLGKGDHSRRIYDQPVDVMVNLYFTESQIEKVNEWLEEACIPGMSYAHTLREWILVGADAGINVREFRKRQGGNKV